MTRRRRNEFSWNCSRAYFWWHRTLTYHHRVTNGDGGLIRTGSANSRRASPRFLDVVRSGAHPRCHPRQLCEGQGRAHASREGAIDATIRRRSAHPLTGCSCHGDHLSWPPLPGGAESGSPLTHAEGSRDRVSILSLYGREVARESWRRRRRV